MGSARARVLHATWATSLTFKGHNELSTKLEIHINSIVSLQRAHTCTSVQTTIDAFFKNFHAPKTLKLETPLQQPPPKCHSLTVAAIEGFHCI